jgi:hypothetical protein
MIRAKLAVAVVGGSGYIGSHVCKALVASGCSVTSISRHGLRTAGPLTLAGEQPGVEGRFPGEAWVAEVSWTEADAADPAAFDAALPDRIDALVCCAGSASVLQMGTDGWVGNDWSPLTVRLYEKNRLPSEACLRAAKANGATRCAFVGASSDVENGFGGTQPGIFKGKRDTFAAAQVVFGEDGAFYFGPHRVTDRRDPLRPLLDSAWARGLIAANRAVGNLGYRGEDLVTKVFLTPPVAVEVLAAAIVGTVTGGVHVDTTERQVYANDGGRDGIELRTTGRYVDGTREIEKVASSCVQLGR